MFLSHLKKNEQAEIIYTKLLEEHLKGIKSIVEKAVHPLVKVIDEDEFINDFIALHDLGKCTYYFQNYLKSGIEDANKLHYHSYIGACTAYNIWREVDELKAFFIYCIIYWHHANLTDIKYIYPDKNKLYAKTQKLNLQYNSILPQILQINKCLGKNLSSKHLAKEALSLFRVVRKIKKQANIKNYFFVNYHFSLLIEADKLDASDTPTYTRKPIGTTLVDDYIKSLNADVNTAQNLLRAKVKQTVIAQLDNKDILLQRLFTFTAPTGIGKTLTSLDFALQLKALIRKKENREAQIIYALPFINIIEQGLKVYEEVFPGYVNVLGHYQFADVFEQSTTTNTEKEENEQYQQKLMQLDTWQSDVVITSFVQFFQTLIGYKNKVLKKFHHLAGSIIILDEVQSLKLGYLPLVGAVLYHLSNLLNARIVLMTATKPLTFELANRVLLTTDKATPFELLTNYEDVFQQFNRTKIIPLLDIELKDTEDLSKEDCFINAIFEKKWSSQKSCLIVCNTVNRSIKLYEAIEKYLADEDLENPLFYLSTNIIPTHRLERILEIKAILKKENGIKPILVATQVVEAGVDLDFDMGFRDLGPLDAIVQVAGRINRNNKKTLEAPIYIVDFKDSKYVYRDKITGKNARALLQKEQYKNGIAEKDYLALIQTYFELVSAESNYDQSRSIYKAMQELYYDSRNSEEIENYKTVSSFKIIEERNNVYTVFIEISDAAKQARECFEKLIGKSDDSEQIDRKKIKIEFDKKYKRLFHQHTIAIPDSYLKKEIDIDNEVYRLTENLHIIPLNLIEQHYKITTGFKRISEDNSVLIL